MELNNTRCFLGIPIARHMAEKLSDMHAQFSTVECDYRNSTYPHITLLAPRELIADHCLNTIKAIVGAHPAQPIAIDEITFWKPSRIVAPFSSDWLVDLHQRIISLSELSQEASEFEGENYHTHLSIAHTTDSATYLPLTKKRLQLPWEAWVPEKVAVYVKRAGERGFTEVRSFAFANAP